MLDHGVDINRTDYSRTEDGFHLSGPNDTSLKVLNSVAARGDIELYDHLIARGADQSRSLALHCASRCSDAGKSTVMIDHLLDKYHMDIEFDNEKLRNNFDTVGDSGTPLNSAVHNRNLAAIHKLLARGAEPEPAIADAIGHFKFSEGYLPALCPLLDAGADLSRAFDWAVRWGNIEAARICLERGADPTDELEQRRLRDARKAPNDEPEEDTRLQIDPKVDEFLRSIRILS
jgi:ankyrin repeat protein